MRPTLTIGIKYAVAVDHFVIFVFKKWKIELSFEPLAEHLAEFFGIFTAVGTDRQDLNFLFLLFRQ